MLNGTGLPYFRRYQGQSSAKQRKWSRPIAPICDKICVLAMGGLREWQAGLHHDLRVVPTE
jgi:hypothetical protein